MNTIEFSAAVCSGKGRRRKHNEDNLFFNGRFLDEKNRDDDLLFSAVEKNSRQLMYGVFDGMGGESLGEVASFLTAEVIADYYGQISEYDEVDLVSFTYHVVREANNIVCERAEAEKVRRMGTTFTTLCIQNDTAVFFNLGDSRSFLLRDGVLQQTSVDDTTVQRKIQMGLITPEEAKTDRDRHKITNFIGIPPEDGGVGFHTSHKISVKKGDCFLLSSDGLTDMVEEDRITEIMTEAADAETAADALFREAVENGGRDNITVIVLEAMSEALLEEVSPSPDRSEETVSSEEAVTITCHPEDRQEGEGLYLEDEEDEGKLDEFDLAFLASLMAEDPVGEPVSEKLPELLNLREIPVPPVDADLENGQQSADRAVVFEEYTAPDSIGRRNAFIQASRYPKRQKLDIVKEKEKDRAWKVLLIITVSVIAAIAACSVYLNFS